jgi:hypothetical protein
VREITGRWSADVLEGAARLRESTGRLTDERRTEELGVATFM